MEQVGDSFSGAMKALNLEVSEVDILDLSLMNYRQLALAKSDIETTLESLFGLLSKKYNFDMTLPLVIDGFPRNDVDVVSIRLLRTKIIRLRNDHEMVLKHIDRHLMEQLGAKENQSIESIQIAIEPQVNAVPFALVKTVEERSPSNKAGLRSGDRIILFDKTIDVSNHEKLTAVAKRVKEREDQSIEITVLRDGSVEVLSLVPTSNWEGRGLLGCHIVPI
ncbi:hypothetical protein PUMCH_003126 [Australozyma saopauloensis]|uniref:Probable 26S proteasome regulatory subunit p27 n=1 Tax=Australozyma saopauloensis TaxID=291208 RepID=A0AAX4HB85_9ASCO|nr:hypothetical protein PUMCH_003126 [[Candida] saopauloensis]